VRRTSPTPRRTTFAGPRPRGRPPEFEPGGDSRKFARLLVARAVLHARSRVRSIKRGGSGGGEAPAGADGSPSSGPSLQRVAVDLDGLQAVGPAVEDLLIASMEVEHLTERLGDPELEQIVTMRLQGYTVREIAREIRQGRATVSRKLLQIRTIWRESGLES
jgi:ECF sigma factor